MPKFKVHMLIGFILFLIFYYINRYYNWANLSDNFIIFQTLAIFLIYSALPDIDQKGSIANRYFTTGIILFSIISIIYYKQLSYALFGLGIIILLQFINHREIIHSVLSALIISIPLLYLGKAHFLLGVIAFTSHIIADNDFSFGWEKDYRF